MALQNLKNQEVFFIVIRCLAFSINPKEAAVRCDKKFKSVKMDFKVKLGLGNNNWFDTNLRICQKSNEIYLEFGEPNSDPIISDRFFSFNQIEVGKDDSPEITLGGTMTRVIRFQDRKDVSNVWLFLKRFIYFPDNLKKSQPNEKLPFSPKVSAESNQDVFNKNNSLTPIILKRNKDFEKNNPIPIIEGDCTINFADISSISFLSSTQTEVTQKSLAQLFETKLIDRDSQYYISDFKKVHQQWKNLLVDQWRNNFKLRKFVADLETAIENSNVQSETMRLVFHDSLVSRMFFVKVCLTIV